MSVIKIRPSEQTLLDLMATDSVDMETDGIQVQPATPYATGVYPIEDLDKLVDQNPDLPTQLLDGTKGYFAPIVRRMGPIYAQASNFFASAVTFQDTQTQLLSFTFPETLEVARQVEVSVHGTCFITGAIGTRMDYTIKVNGVAQVEFRNYMSELSSPTAFVGNWIVTLPAGVASVVTVHGRRVSGTGTINFDGNTFLNMTIKG